MHICIIGSDRWFIGNESGGAEKQLALISLVLVERGHEVTFVVPGEERAKLYRDKIRFISGWKEDRGIPAIRYFTYRTPNLKHVLIELKADLYYARGASIFAPIVVNASRRINSISLIGLAHIADLDWTAWKKMHPFKSISYYAIEYLKSQYFIQLGLRKASIVAVQNEDQAEKLSKYDCPSIYFPNIITCTIDDKYQSSRKYDLCWVGAITARKGVSILRELILEYQAFNIAIVGNICDKPSEILISELEDYQNCDYHGQLSNKDVQEILSISKLHINTSPSEGFPNTFLEAWCAKTPVVSFSSNPNGLLTGNNSLGLCANGSLDEMVSSIRTLLADNSQRLEMGIRAKQYVLNNHSPAKAAHILEQLVRNFHNPDQSC